MLQQQQNLGWSVGTSKMHLCPPPPNGLGCCRFHGNGSVIVESLFIVTMFCCALLCVHSSFAIILMGRAGCFGFLSSWCLVIVVWLLITLTPVCLQCVIVVFPDNTHYFCLSFTWSWTPKIVLIMNGPIK